MGALAAHRKIQPPCTPKAHTSKPMLHLPAPALQFGFCELLHSPDVAAGQPPSFGDFGPMTVPLLAGYVSSAPPVVAAGGAGRRLAGA